MERLLRPTALLLLAIPLLPAFVLPAEAGSRRAVYRETAELTVRVRVVSPCEVQPLDPACAPQIDDPDAGAAPMPAPLRTVRVREQLVDGVRLRTVEY